MRRIKGREQLTLRWKNADFDHSLRFCAPELLTAVDVFFMDSKDTFVSMPDDFPVIRFSEAYPRFPPIIFDVVKKFTIEVL